VAVRRRRRRRGARSRSTVRRQTTTEPRTLRARTRSSSRWTTSTFEPTVLEGEAGQTLTLEAFNEGDEEHNVTIEDQGIDEDIEPDDEGEVEVTFPDSGTVVFFCKYHQDQGMRGALRVAS
jgi:plastocyanin